MTYRIIDRLLTLALFLLTYGIGVYKSAWFIWASNHLGPPMMGV